MQIKPGRRSAWELSAQSADQALSVEGIDQRLQLYTFQYHDMPGYDSLTSSTVTSQPAVAASSDLPSISLPPPPKPSKPSTVKRKKTAMAEKPTKKIKYSPSSGGANKQRGSESPSQYTSVKSPPTSLSNSSASYSDVTVDDPFAFDESGK